MADDRLSLLIDHRGLYCYNRTLLQRDVMQIKGNILKPVLLVSQKGKMKILASIKVF